LARLLSVRVAATTTVYLRGQGWAFFSSFTAFCGFCTRRSIGAVVPLPCSLARHRLAWSFPLQRPDMCRSGRLWSARRSPACLYISSSCLPSQMTHLGTFGSCGLVRVRPSRRRLRCDVLGSNCVRDAAARAVLSAAARSRRVPVGDRRSIRQSWETANPHSLETDFRRACACCHVLLPPVSTPTSDARRRFHDASHRREDERHRSGVVVEYVGVRAGWSVVRQSLLSQIAFLWCRSVVRRRPRHEAVSALPHHARRDGPSGRPLTYRAGVPPGPRLHLSPRWQRGASLGCFSYLR